MARDKKRFQRRERTAEDMRRKASEGSRDYDRLFVGDVKMFKPREGENQIRIMPPCWGLQPYTDEELDEMSDEELAKLQKEEDNFGSGWDITLYVHYDVGPEKASYLCRDKMLGESCPVCEAKAQARDAEEADRLGVTKRALCYVIDRNAEKDGPQVWSMPWSKIRNEIYARSVDKKHGTPIFIDDEEEGYDVFFRREGEKDRTNYTGVEIDREPVPLHESDKTMDRWLAFTMKNRLLDILNFYDDEHIRKVLFGRKSARREDVEDEEDEEEKTGGRRTSLRSRRQSRDASEERDYLEDESGGEDKALSRTRSSRSARRSAEPEEEDETAHSSRRRRTTTSVAADPDDEQPDEEDDDDNPLPDREDGDGAPPEEQVRSRLRGLRSRRGRG